MATDSKGKWAKAGLGSILFSAVGFLLDLLGLPEDLGRWRLIVGEVTVEGLSAGLQQLALLAGLMLATPWIVETIGKRLQLIRQRRNFFRKASQSAKAILPHLNKNELSTLRSALAGPINTSLPGNFGVPVWIRHDAEGSLFALKPEYRAPLEEFFAEEDRKAEERRRARIEQAIRTANRPMRTVLWAFGKPHLEEPASALDKRKFREAIVALWEAGVFHITWAYGHYSSIPEELRLVEDAVPAVEELLLKRQVRRSSVRIRPPAHSQRSTVG